MTEQLAANPLVIIINILYDHLNSCKFIGFVVSSGIFAYYLVKRNKKAIYIGYVLMIVIFTMLSITFFGYSDYYRFPEPVDSLLTFLALVPMLFLKIS